MSFTTKLSARPVKQWVHCPAYALCSNLGELLTDYRQPDHWAATAFTHALVILLSVVLSFSILTLTILWSNKLWLIERLPTPVPKQFMLRLLKEREAIKRMQTAYGRIFSCGYSRQVKDIMGPTGSSYRLQKRVISWGGTAFLIRELFFWVVFYLV